MQKTLIVLGIIALVGLTSAVLSAESTYKFKVTGLHCYLCPKAVEKAAQGVKGVSDVKVTLIDGKWQNGGILDVKTEDTVKPI